MNRHKLIYAKGQGLVEIALLLPVLLLIAVVIVDLGRAIYYYSAIQNAAREAVRYGVVNTGKAGIFTEMENKAEEYAFGLGLDSISVSAQRGDDQVVGIICNATYKVTVFYSFQPATPILSQFISGGITLRSEAVMRTEGYLPCL